VRGQDVWSTASPIPDIHGLARICRPAPRPLTPVPGARGGATQVVRVTFEPRKRYNPAMLARRFESLISAEVAKTDLAQGMPDDVPQRFDSLRGYRLLPTGRAKNVTHLTVAQMASAILSITTANPAFAGLAATTLSGLPGHRRFVSTKPNPWHRSRISSPRSWSARSHSRASCLGQ
jgi:hypothetical protein